MKIHEYQGKELFRKFGLDADNIAKVVLEFSR